VNSIFLQELDRAGREDLLETIVHEGLHVDQPESIWRLDQDGDEYKIYHADLADRAFKKIIPLRDQYREERTKCQCSK